MIGTREGLQRAVAAWRRPAAVVTNLESFVGLQTARVLHGHGIPVVGLADSPKAPMCRTRAVEAVFDSGREGSRLVSVLEELAPVFKDKPALLPCSDDAVLAVSAARQDLAYRFRLPEHQTVELLSDKGRFLAHARDLGVPVSPFSILTTRDDAVRASGALRYPLVLKPVRKNPTWDERTGQKAHRVPGPQELLAIWDRAVPDYPVLAQEWVEGGDQDLYSFNGYFDENGTPLATFIARKVRQWPPHTGIASLGIECRNDEVLDVALRLFSSLPYSGFAYLEMKRDRRTGKHYAIEANIGRPTGRGFIAEAGGVELISTAYCDALGLPLPDARTQTYGDAKWIYLGRDLASAWYYRRRGELTLREWWQSIRGPKKYAVFSWSDPLPFVTDLVQGFRRARRSGRLS